MRPQPLKKLITGIDVDYTGCSVNDMAVTCGVKVSAGGNEAWDDVVARSVSEELLGIEALSGIPGTITDAVRTNAAAHGQSVGDVVDSVRTWDRQLDAQKTFPAADGGFGPYESRFQETLSDGSARYEILEVTLLLTQGNLTKPLSDAALAERVGASLGDRVPTADVRRALA